MLNRTYTFRTEYAHGDKVYHVTDKDQNVGIITDIEISPNNLVSYYVNFGTSSTKHYEFELSQNEDTALRLK